MPEQKYAFFKGLIAELRGFAPIGIMELWSNGMMGLKEFFTIKMVYFRLYPQYSSIPFFHSGDINRLPLINLYFQEVVEFPRRLFMGL